MAIMKKYLIIIIIFVLGCGISGYYLWCSYNPFIKISIGAGGSGEQLKVELPYVAYGEKYGIEMAQSVKQNLMDFQDKAESVLQDVLNNYKNSDIKLDIKVKNKQTILNYSGIATNLNDEVVEYNKEIICDYVLNNSYLSKILN